MNLTKTDHKTIARDMFILENVALEVIATTLDIPLKELNKWNKEGKWSFIKGTMDKDFGTQLLDLNGGMTEVYSQAMVKAVELMNGIKTPRQMQELMSAIRLIDDGLVQHYGINSLIKVVKDNEKLGMM